MKATLSAIVLGIALGLAAPAAAQFGPPPPADPNAPTPRLASGKPDLTGSWVRVSGGLQGSGGNMFRRCTPFQSKNCMEWTNQSEDWVFMSATRLDERQPLYKPEHWDKIIELDQWTNKYDPVMTCLPLGIPRQGPPARVFQTESDITMFYRGGIDGSAPASSPDGSAAAACSTRFFPARFARYRAASAAATSASGESRPSAASATPKHPVTGGDPPPRASQVYERPSAHARRRCARTAPRRNAAR